MCSIYLSIYPNGINLFPINKRICTGAWPRMNTPTASLQKGKTPPKSILI